MIPFFYRGALSPSLVSHVLANAKSFDDTMRQSVEAFGGKLIRCFLTAASSDPIGFLEFELDSDARAWNIFYGSQEGIQSSDIHRLLSADDLSLIAERITDCSDMARGHRDEVK